MAARTDSVVRKSDQAENASRSWCLELNPGCGAEFLPLQKWREVENCTSRRDQIVAHQMSNSAGKENVISVPSEVLHPKLSPKESLPSSEVTAMAEDDLESHGNSKRAQSVECDESRKCSRLLCEEDNTVVRSPSRSVSVSGGSEWKNADGFISEDESNEMDEEDNVELAVEVAHSFKIFQVMDNEEPASVLDLDFDLKLGESSSTSLFLVGYSMNNLTGSFMRTIVSWTVKSEDDQKLTLYVRDVKGSLIELRNPQKSHEVSVLDARILVSFLELAIILRDTNVKTFLDVLVEKTGRTRGKIKSVLRNSFDTVVKKSLLLQRVPSSLKTSPIIKKMESFLMSVIQKKTNEPGAPLESPSTSNRVKRPSSAVLAKQFCADKKRRIVEPDPEGGSDAEDHIPLAHRIGELDPEGGSDSEDHIPLAHRNFQRSESLGLEKAVSRGEDRDNNTAKIELAKAYGGSEKHANISPGMDFPSPGSDRSTCPSRWQDVQEFLDIAEIYGGQSDGSVDLGDDNVDDDDEELGDSAFCAICDDGGKLLFCDGPCMRSFHASDEAGAMSKCGSLGFTADQVADMGSWLCPSCKEKKHQCFICGKLGRSEGKDKEVFVCDVALCGRFYHPNCLANWKRKEKFSGIADIGAFIKGVVDGVEEFCCPAHKCANCGDGEEVEDGGIDNPMKLAKCRRCPRAYHRGCMPKKISFKVRGTEPVRAWEIGKGLLIYCLDHIINTKLNTPDRKHLMWPDGTIVGQKISHKHLKLTLPLKSHDLKPKPKGLSLSKSVPRTAFPGTVSKRNMLLKPDKKAGMRKPVVCQSTAYETSVYKASLNPVRPMVTRVTSLNPVLPLAKHLSILKKPVSHTVRRPADTVKNSKVKEPTRIAQQDPIVKEQRKKRLLGFLQKASEQFSLDDVKETLEQPSCYGENKRRNVLHRGEFISILNAAKKGMEKLKNGGSLEDAKRLCPKDLFIQMLKAEETLKVYLAPFLHGVRYTSFGRHFTCVEKLQEIVERIHPYVDSGDMIVDFCCGANDFSILLNKKLISVGKTCFFMNFDIHPPKNSFCFSKGDWLKNTGAGFLEGKRLIMGLNPPFGVKAALATKFVEHALNFRPKLLVLIVPPETMRLNSIEICSECRRFTKFSVGELIVSFARLECSIFCRQSANGLALQVLA